LHQSRQVECAAEVLSECPRAGGALRQQLDDGALRPGQSDGVEEASCRGHQASSVLAANHGSLVQGGEGASRRGCSHQRKLQEGAGIADGLPEQRLPVVSGRRSRLRQLYGPPRAELSALRTNPRLVMAGLPAIHLTPRQYAWMPGTRLGI